MNNSSILQWNCRGLRLNFNELQLLISQYDPKIICLQETKLSENNPPTLRHYSAYYYYEVRTRSTQTDRETDEQTDRE